MFQLMPQSQDLIPMSVCKERFPSHLSATRARQKSPVALLSLADIRKDPRGSGACFCPFVLSCAGGASSGGVHLGYFHGVVDAVRASVLDASPNSLYTNF